MDRILWQCIPVSRMATITAVACQLLVSYLVGHAVALQRATNTLGKYGSPDRYNSPDKYLKFSAAQDDAFIADVRGDGYSHPLRFGARNA
jgi:hypothetical protein